LFILNPGIFSARIIAQIQEKLRIYLNSENGTLAEWFLDIKPPMQNIRIIKGNSWLFKKKPPLLVLLSTNPLAHNPTSHGDLLVPAEELGILGHDWDDFPLEVVAVLHDLHTNHLDVKRGGILGTYDVAVVVNLHLRGPHK
jgi:hypothetical protein